MTRSAPVVKLFVRTFLNHLIVTDHSVEGEVVPANGGRLRWIPGLITPPFLLTFLPS